ncbi:unnamed protein product, partial [Owenia fusiformis]
GFDLLLQKIMTMQYNIPTITYISIVTLSLLVTFMQIETVSGSVGDNSQPFIECLATCRTRLCGISDIKYENKLPFYMRWLKWNCVDDCKYQCMWPTVEFFKDRGWPIPQFHGKWPFTRCYGIQEPASVVFSILNAITLIYNLWWYRKKVEDKAPLYNIVHVGNVVSVNAWVWSSVFHTRDTRITEMLDYFCAISLVIYSVFMLACRVFGTERPLKASICGLILFYFFVWHVHYLAYVKFDYGYNIKATVSVGVLNSIGWLIWCAVVRKRQPYVWKCALSIVLLNLLILLEVGDFPPIWWVFDAHSLWHAGTVPLPFIWYSFLIDDCNYLLKEKQQRKEQSIDATSSQTAEEVIKKIS